MLGAWFSIQLEQEGHHVDVWLQDDYDEYRYVLSGLIRTPLRAKPNFKNYDLVLFDQTDRPEIAEEVMRQGISCIGDGDLNTQLDNDRSLSIEVMEQCGINVPFYEAFNDIQEAKKFVRKTNKRYVFKPDDIEGQEKSSTYVSKSAEDMLKYLDKLYAIVKSTDFILQEVVEGTEVSTEAWFNGNDFVFICGTLEEKKFMEGNKGPNTGCAGNLEIIYDQTNPPLIFREGIGKAKDFLQSYHFRGNIDLNAIATDSKLYGLEWTPRFGYDATATLFSCLSNVTDFLGEIATGGQPSVSYSNSFASSIRLSIPPYPSEIKGSHPEDVPIEGIEEDDIPKNCYLYDCGIDKQHSLCTVGAYGLVAAPIQSGGSIQEAWYKVKEKIKRIQIPNCQYRDDIEETTTKRYKILSEQGWLR